MFLLFVLLEYLLNLGFRQCFGGVSEVVLHLALSFVLLGTVSLFTGKKVNFDFGLSIFILFICAFSYLVAYKTRQALGAPLHFIEALENLEDDRTLLAYLRDYPPKFPWGTGSVTRPQSFVSMA